MAAFHAYQAKDFSRAAACCRVILKRSRTDVPALHILGASLMQLESREAGLEVLQNALTLDPDDITIRSDLASGLTATGQVKVAIGLLADGDRTDPDLMIRLARLLTGEGEYTLAQSVLKKALDSHPERSDLHCLLAAEYAADRRFEDALTHYKSAEMLTPEAHAVKANLGVVMQALGRLDESIDYYRQSIALAPDEALQHINLGTALLARHDYAEGFSELEWRHHCLIPLRKERPAPLWNGEPLNGRRLLVSAEQGYGDCLQFVRFIPRLATFGGYIIVECRRGLERLFSILPGVNECVILGEPLPPVDFEVLQWSLPHILKVDANDLGGDVPYLKPVPGVASPVPVDDDPRPKVGLFWKGGDATGELYVRRSLNRRALKLKEWGPILDVPGIRFISLQVGEAAQQITESPVPILDLSSHLHDFADTAAAIADLDLVLTIDTSVPHLAGGMGHPTWLLLAPAQADFRWEIDGETTPWYHSIRLFRSDRSGWSSMLRRTSIALATWRDEWLAQHSA